MGHSGGLPSKNNASVEVQYLNFTAEIVVNVAMHLYFFS